MRISIFKKFISKLKIEKSLLVFILLLYFNVALKSQVEVSLCITHGNDNIDLTIPHNANLSNPIYASYNFNGKKVFVEGDFIIDQAIVFNNVRFQFAQLGRIVGGTHNLEFYNCKLFSCAPNWRGVEYVGSQGLRTLTFNSCRIEDYLQIHTLNTNFTSVGCTYQLIETVAGGTSNFHEQTSVNSGNTVINYGASESYNFLRLFTNRVIAVRVNSSSVNGQTAIFNRNFIQDAGIRAIHSLNTNLSIKECTIRGFNNGYGIEKNGGNLNISDGTVFENCGTGIYVYNSNSLFILNTSFTQNTFRGIFSVNNTGTISNCTYDINNDNTNVLKYFIQAYSSRLNVVNNANIKLKAKKTTGLAFGSSGRYTVKGNTFTPIGTNADRNAFSFANVFFEMIENNTVGKKGFIKNGVYGSRISSNTFTNDGDNIAVTLSKGISFCFNNYSSTGTLSNPPISARNLVFSGNCSSTRLVQENFNGGGVGLEVDDMIGDQYRKGNKWNGTYTAIGAKNGGNPDFSEIHTPSGLPNTPTHSPNPGWFFDQAGAPLDNCAIVANSDLTLDKHNLAIINNTFNSTPLSEWMSKIDTYRKLYLNPNLRSTNDIITWYNNNSNLLEIINTTNYINEAYNSAVSPEVVSNKNEELKNLYFLLITHAAGSVEYNNIKNQILALETSIQNDNDVINNHKSYNLNLALSSCNNVSVTNTYEDNFKKIYLIYIRKLIDGINFTMTQTELSFVNYIAELCPLVSGAVVYVAKDILGEEALLTENPNCTESTPRSSGISLQDNKFEFYIYPNPSYESINITMDSELKEVRILDMAGKFKSKHKSNEIDINHLEKGLYIIEVIDIHNIKSVSKFIKM